LTETFVLTGEGAEIEATLVGGSPLWPGYHEAGVPVGTVGPEIRASAGSEAD